MMNILPPVGSQTPTSTSNAWACPACGQWIYYGAQTCLSVSAGLERIAVSLERIVAMFEEADKPQDLQEAAEGL